MHANRLPPVFRDHVQAELFEWLKQCAPANGIAMTLTFDPKRGGGHRCRDLAEKAFTRFTGMLNGDVYNNAYYRRRKRLSIIPILEGGGTTGKNYHYHAIVEVPGHIDEERFKTLISEAWGKQGCAGNCHLEKVRDEGWLGYVLKIRDKDDLLDAVDLRNLSLN